tara:strand:+ start:201 stop:737 length:537 start_codon:yes stop_codon:yes gene_type:complete
LYRNKDRTKRVSRQRWQRQLVGVIHEPLPADRLNFTRAVPSEEREQNFPMLLVHHLPRHSLNADEAQTVFLVEVPFRTDYRSILAMAKARAHQMFPDHLPLAHAMQPFAGLRGQQHRLRVHEGDYLFQKRVVEVVQPERLLGPSWGVGPNLRVLEANRNQRVRVMKLTTSRVDDDARG